MRYFLLRLARLPLSLLLLSLLCFGLRALVPDDRVAAQLPAAEARLAEQDPAAYDRSYRRAAARLGLDRPAFYLTLANGALPDTLHRIVRPGERAMVRALTLRYGNWAAVQDYYRTLRRAAHAPAAADPGVPLRLRRLLLQDDPDRVAATVADLPPGATTAAVVRAHHDLGARADRAALLLPALRWWGTDNRYHHWLTDLLAGRLGRSYADQRPVGEKIGRALGYTLWLNGLALLLVFAVAIPVGLTTAGRAGGHYDRWTSLGLFVLFGVPSFWAATLLANFLTTPAYGLDWFPSMGFGTVPPGAGWWQAFRIRASHLFLPVLCLAYPSWAYVSRQLRRSAVRELAQPYVRTARLTGLSPRRVLWGHVLRNASFPLVTILGGLLPALLAGSVLIERIFNLPGMGQLLYEAALGRDWPVLLTVVLLTGVLTTLGLLLADLAYALLDPRVRLGNFAHRTPPAR